MDHHPHHPLTGIPHPDPRTCCTEALRKVRWARRPFICHPECGLASINFFPLSYCLQPGGGSMQDPLDTVCYFFLVVVLVSVSGKSEHGSTSLSLCTGFGQDRVNFHRTPGRGTAGGWGLTPAGQTEPGIPYHVMSRWVPVGGWRGGNSLAARERTVPGRSERASLFLLCFLLICIVVVPVSLCLLFC